MTTSTLSLLQKVQAHIDTCGVHYLPDEAPQILFFAAAAQTLHLSPKQAGDIFLEAREKLINAGAGNEARVPL
jgi:hypothetical protein